MSKYTDPPEKDEILKRLLELKTIGDVKKLSEIVFPGWFVATSRDYCKDYQFLSMNWKKVCETVGVKQAMIILVDDITFDDSHIITKAFAECFTRAGFSVRCIDEYKLCPKCLNAVPCLQMWTTLKKKGMIVPIKWSERCTNCQ
jgi:hypothetical protein